MDTAVAADIQQPAATAGNNRGAATCDAATAAYNAAATYNATTAAYNAAATTYDTATTVAAAAAAV